MSRFLSLDALCIEVKGCPNRYRDFTINNDDNKSRTTTHSISYGAVATKMYKAQRRDVEENIFISQISVLFDRQT